MLLGEPLRRYTSLGIGGPAQALVFPSDAEDLQQLLKLAHDAAIPFYVLGAGSNLLVRDGGFKGLVVSLCLGFKRISHRENIIKVQAGAHVSKLLAYAQANNLGGLEFLAGIPGTVGGAVAMNAGAGGSEIGQRVKAVSVLTPDVQYVRFTREKINFGYRSSSLADCGIVLGAELELSPMDSGAVADKVSRFLSERKRNQPAGSSAGSIFKNPPGDYAGRLIEEAGLKGVSIGDAQVSAQHGNFILNKGTASARDVEALIQLVQKEVARKKGVCLEPEVKIIGEAARN